MISEFRHLWREETDASPSTTGSGLTVNKRLRNWRLMDIYLCIWLCLLDRKTSCRCRIGESCRGRFLANLSWKTFSNDVGPGSGGPSSLTPVVAVNAYKSHNCISQTSKYDTRKVHLPHCRRKSGTCILLGNSGGNGS